MLATLENIFNLSSYESKLEQQRARSAYLTLVMMLILVSAYIFLIPDVGSQGELTRFQDALNGSSISLFFIGFFYTMLSFLYYLVRRGLLNTSGIGICLLWFIIAIVPAVLNTQNLIQPDVTLSLSLFIILGGLILFERGLMVSTAVALFMLLIFYEPIFIRMLPIIVSQLVGVSIFTYMYIRYAKVNYDAGSEGATAERIKLADIMMQITSLTLTRTDISNVLEKGIDLIQQGYPQFYHVQVFLVDDSGHNAQLVSSTGNIGRALIQTQHSIGVGSQSVIGQATLRNTHIIARTTDTNSIHRYNELLPDTVLEMAFPLNVGEQVLGALDLQSKSDLAIDEIDIFTYQSLANSFALAIDHVRQSKLTEARIIENQKLAKQANEALNEVNRLNRQFTEQVWSEYLKNQSKQRGLNIDLETNAIEESQSWSTTLSQAVKDGDVIQSGENDQQVIAIPLKIRGQVIGAMEFELGEDGTMDPGDINLIQEVSERFSLAAENTRLVEESQRTAYREAMINDIGSRLQTSNTIESTMTEAVRSLNGVLDAKRVSIKLKAQDETH